MQMKRNLVHPWQLDSFGEIDPRRMPRHFFFGAVELNYASAIRADISKQDFSVAPRHWYIDATFECGKCHRDFIWTAREQRVWFEKFRFWIDSFPRLCRSCKSSQRRLERLRKEYDNDIAAARDHGSPEQKARIIEIISRLREAGCETPVRMLETADLFERQLMKTQEK